MASSPENSQSNSVTEDCYRRWHASLVRFAWAVTRDWNLAHDAVHSAFLDFAKSEKLIGSESRKAWLYKVTFRCAVKLRSEKAKIQSTEEPMSTDDGTSQLSWDPTDRLVREEDLERAGAAIEKLPYEQRRVLELKIYEGLSFAEIASQLEIPLGTALSRMRLAMERIRDSFPKDLGL